jgi:hypothetical protein
MSRFHNGASRAPRAGLFGAWTTADAPYSWFTPSERPVPRLRRCAPDWDRSLECLARYLKG